MVKLPDEDVSSFADAPLIVSAFGAAVYVIVPVLLMTPVRIIPELLPSSDDVPEMLNGPVPAIVPPAHLMPPPAVTAALNVCVPLTNLTGPVPLNDEPLLNVLLPPNAIPVVLPETNDPLCVPLPASPIVALPALTEPLLFRATLMELVVPPVLLSVPMLLMSGDEMLSVLIGASPNNPNAPLDSFLIVAPLLMERAFAEEVSVKDPKLSTTVPPVMVIALIEPVNV